MNADGKNNISISAFHGAVPDKSLPLKLNFFETEQQGKLQSRYLELTNHLSEVRLIESVKLETSRIPA